MNKTEIENKIKANEQKAQKLLVETQELLKSLEELQNSTFEPTSGKAIYDKLEELGEDYDEILDKYSDGKPIDLGNGYQIVHKLTHGGSEGDGEEHWKILEATKDGVLHSYWEVPGWYQSYNGAELNWDEMFQVEPKEQTVIVYLPIQ